MDLLNADPAFLVAMKAILRERNQTGMKVKRGRG